MSTPNPTDPDQETKREREEERRRRQAPGQQPGQPRKPEVDRPGQDEDETEENWSRTPR